VIVVMKVRGGPLLGNQVKLTLERALDDTPSGMRHWLATGAGQKPIPRFPDG
jgi:hypothetical protein